MFVFQFQGVEYIFFFSSHVITYHCIYKLLLYSIFFNFRYFISIILWCISIYMFYPFSLHFPSLFLLYFYCLFHFSCFFFHFSLSFFHFFFQFFFFRVPVSVLEWNTSWPSSRDWLLALFVPSFLSSCRVNTTFYHHLFYSGEGQS